MAVSDEIKAAVIAAHGGRATVGDIARRYGLKRSQVAGIWQRRPRDTPEEAARVAARAAAEAAVAQRPFSLDDAPFEGLKGAAWKRLVAAGPRGATRQEIVAAMYPTGDWPASWRTSLTSCLRDLRSVAERNGYEVALLSGVNPSRWCVRKVGEVAPPRVAEVAAAAEPADVAPGPTLVAAPAPAEALLPIVREEPVAPVGLSGAAAAVASLKRGCCKWPLGEPNGADFRFCGAGIQGEGMPYCPEHRQAASAGLWSPRRAA